MRSLRGRFWVEMALTAISIALLVVTLAWREWIEIVFKVEPDHGSGTLGWVVVVGALVFAVTFSISAGRGWGRAVLLPRTGEGAS